MVWVLGIRLERFLPQRFVALVHINIVRNLRDESISTPLSIPKPQIRASKTPIRKTINSQSLKLLQSMPPSAPTSPGKGLNFKVPRAPLFIAFNASEDGSLVASLRLQTESTRARDFGLVDTGRSLEYREPPKMALIDTLSDPPVCSLYVGEIEGGDGTKFRAILQSVPVIVGNGKTPSKRASIHEEWVLTIVRKLWEQGYRVKVWTKEEVAAERTKALRKGSIH
jgi:hypothetical protein